MVSIEDLVDRIKAAEARQKQTDRTARVWAVLLPDEPSYLYEPQRPVDKEGKEMRELIGPRCTALQWVPLVTIEGYGIWCDEDSSQNQPDVNVPATTLLITEPVAAGKLPYVAGTRVYGTIIVRADPQE